MSRRAGAVWFIGITVAAVGTELLFALDSSPGTVPWTGYLTQLPWWALAPLVLGFSLWLPYHLWDAKRRAERQARLAGLLTAQAALLDRLPAAEAETATAVLDNLIAAEDRADAEQQPTDR